MLVNEKVGLNDMDMVLNLGFGMVLGGGRLEGCVGMEKEEKVGTCVTFHDSGAGGVKFSAGQGDTK